MPEDSVQSVQRAVSLMLALDASTPSLDATTLAARTNLSRSTVYRLLATLEQTGMVHKHGSRFELGPQVLKLAGGYRAANHISGHAKSVLDDLADDVRTGVTLAVLDNDVVVTVEIGNALNGDYVLQPHELGRRIPAAATSVGRMLLAYQETVVESNGSEASPIDEHNLHAAEQIRRQGFALSSGLLEAGVRTIAVPVYDSTGDVIAGLGILADADRTSSDELVGDHLPKLRAAADRLTELSRDQP